LAEPTSSGVGIAALAVALVGPVFGPYAVIVWAAFAGAMWPLSKRNTPSRIEGAWFVLRVVFLATIITTPLAIFAETQFKVPSQHALGLVALAVGAIGDDWPRIFKAIGRMVAQRVNPTSKGDEQ